MFWDIGAKGKVTLLKGLEIRLRSGPRVSLMWV